VLIGGTAKSGATGYLYVYTKSCLFCDTGSFVNNGACQSCTNTLVACAMCFNNITCSSCFQGYYLQINNTCATCSGILNGCSTCINSTNCIECNNGFYLNGIICTPCNPAYVGCISCNSTACLLCDMDYQLAGIACIRCAAAGCLRCNSTGGCI
jgi:proprotein convertase subtilisin/kexin type 5